MVGEVSQCDHAERESAEKVVSVWREERGKEVPCRKRSDGRQRGHTEYHRDVPGKPAKIGHHEGRDYERAPLVAIATRNTRAERTLQPTSFPCQMARLLHISGDEDDDLVSRKLGNIVKLKPAVSDLLRMGAGAAVMLVLVLLVFHYQRERSPARQIELKARKADMVGRMRYALAAASEAEKSAVLAVTDQDSQTFADQARAATAEVESLRQSLGESFAASASQKEKDLLATFSRGFANLLRIDRDLLALTGKNTNIKAFALAFGPAAQAAQETDSALSRFLAKHAISAQKTLLLAAGAQAALLRIETRLPPHIAELSDPRMDEMEALMDKDDRQVRAGLDGLAAQPDLRADSDVASARAGYARFSELRAQILALSRQNTNVRSLAMSLDQKRKAMFTCQDALHALQQQIAGEPIPEAPSNPRRLGAAPHTGH